MASPGAISDRALASLRSTAAVLAAVPMVHARIRFEHETLLEVRRPPFPDCGDHPLLPPCAFRRSVARAHAYRKQGEQLGFRGLPAGGEPTIDWIVAAGDVVLPGSILQCSTPGTWWHIAAVAMPLAAAAAAALGEGEGEREREQKEPASIDLRFHGDPDLDTTVLHISTEAGRVHDSSAAIDALQAAIARCAVAELIDHMNASAPDLPVFPS